MNLSKLLFVFVASAATIAAESRAALITFDDGTEHTINSATGDQYLVLDGPGPSVTTLIVESPAVINAGPIVFQHGIELNNSSVGQITGGTITAGGGLFAAGIRTDDWDGELSISGGTINGGNADSTAGLSLSGSGTVNVTGGMIAAGSGGDANGIAMADTVVVNLAGGTVAGAGANDPIVMSGDSVLNFTRGTLTGSVSYTDRAIVNVFGLDFNLNGNPIAPGSYAGTGGTLTFTDGGGVDQTLGLNSGLVTTTLTLVAVPEPNSAALLGFACSALTVIRVRRRTG